VALSVAREQKFGEKLNSCSTYCTPFPSAREEGSFCAVNNQLGETRLIMYNHYEKQLKRFFPLLNAACWVACYIDQILDKIYFKKTFATILM